MSECNCGTYCQDTGGGCRYVEDDCEDQSICPTKTCTICRRDFDSAGKPIYAPLVKRGRYWRCEDCGSSYGEHPHSDLR